MSIDWNDNLLVGVDTIDNQHREIFGNLSNLLHAMSEGKGRRALNKTIAFLSGYVYDHFKLEEDLMRQNEYPGEDVSRMKADHAILLEKFTDLKKRYLEEGATLHLVVETQQRLCEWLANHISVEDKKLAGFLKAKRNV